MTLGISLETQHFRLSLIEDLFERCTCELRTTPSRALEVRYLTLSFGYLGRLPLVLVANSGARSTTRTIVNRNTFRNCVHHDRIMSVTHEGLGTIEFDGLLVENSTAFPRCKSAAIMKFSNIVIRGSASSAFSNLTLSLTTPSQAFRTSKISRF